MMPANQLDNDQQRSQEYQIKNFGNNGKNIVKRSVNQFISLTKIFSEFKRQYSCQMNLTFFDFSLLNQLIFIEDDITRLDINTLNTNGIINATNSNLIRIQFNFTGKVNLFVNYNFVPRDMSGTEVRTVTVYGGQMNRILSQSACLILANFNDTVGTNLALICCFFLALLIIIIIFIIIWIKICLPKYQKEYINISVEKCQSSSIQKYSLLLDEFQKNNNNERSDKDNKSFIDAISTDQLRDIQYKIFELDLERAKNADDKLKNDLVKFNDIFFTIWLNSIVKQSPHLKDKISQISKQISNEKENIKKKYQNQLNDKMKEITKQIIEINNDNLRNLQMTQDSERERLMKMVTSDDQMELDENLKKLFESEAHNILIQLKVKQEEALEEAKMKSQTDMLNEINSSQMSLIETLTTDHQISPEDGDEIMKRYVQWQHKLQAISESEKIRQAASMTYLLESRLKHSKEKEEQNKSLHELLENKTAYFENTINELEENDEISGEMSRKILAQFENDKENIMREMEKSKETQLNSLLIRLNQNKQKQLEDLKIQQENEINNLTMIHLPDTDILDLVDEILHLESSHCQEVAEAEKEIDDENTETLINFLQEIGTQTLLKIDEKITEISSELTREGFSEADIKDILDGSNKKIQKIQKLQQKEREKQKRQLEDRLQKIKEEIDSDSIQQSKNQNNILGVQNDVMNEIIDMQKTLSNEERNKIMEQYTKNKFSIEQNLTASRLLQKRKIEELVNAKKTKENTKLSKELDGKIKEINEKGLKRRDQEYTSNAVSKCILDFVEAKLNVVNRENSQKELDKEMKKINNEILEERAFLIHKKEEEIASLLNKIQILKASEYAELKEQQDKLMQLQMVALDSIDGEKNVQGIMKKHNQDRERINDAIFMNRKQQEEQVKRRREKKNRMSLLRESSDGAQDSEKEDDFQRNKQNIDNEILKTNIKSETELKQLQVDFFKELVATGNFPRFEIVNLLRDKFPLKTNQEIETIAEEIYPKSQEVAQKQKPQKSLVESQKKIDENFKLKNTMLSRPSSALSIKSTQRRFTEKDDIEIPQYQDKEYENKKSRRKKKKNRGQSFDENDDEEAF